MLFYHELLTLKMVTSPHLNEELGPVNYMYYFLCYSLQNQICCLIH